MRRPLFLVAVLGYVSAVLASPGAGWCERNFVAAQGEHAERVRRALEDFEVESPGLHQVEPEAALLRVEDVAIARVNVRARPGEAFRAPLVLEGAVMTLDLKPQSHRAPGFQVELRGPGGVTTLLDPGPVRTLLGTIREVPGSVVAGSLLESGLEAMVRLPDETTLWLEPVRKHLTDARRDLYVVSSCGLEEGMEKSCGVEHALGELKGRLRSISSASTNGNDCASLGGCVADLLCDTDYAFYYGNNEDPDQVRTTVESIIALVNPEYADLKIRYQISSIVIRSDPDPDIDPYANGVSLETMAETWGYGTHTSDLVHLFTGQSTYPVAGLAYIGGVCGFGTFGMYSFSSGNTGGCQRAGLVIHELGHSWGADHSTGFMTNPAGTCASYWSELASNAISSKRNIVDGICLDLDNQPPQPRFSFSCSSGSCSFDASASTDDRGIQSYSWSFGGGQQATATTSHTYTATGAHTVTLTVTDIYGLQASTSRLVSVNVDAPLPAERYFAVAPCRIADTRSGAPLIGGQPQVFNVVASSCGIPSTAKAVSVNITTVSPTAAGHLVFRPGNVTSEPFLHAETTYQPSAPVRNNNAIVRLATNGAGTVAVGSSGGVHLILDVYGYFSEDTTPALGASGPLGFQSVPPCRIADTRTTNTPLAVNTTRNFTVQGACGVPVGAAAAALNPVLIAPTASGHATLFQAGAFPPVPTINFNAWTVQTNGTRIRLAAATEDVSLNYFSQTAGASTHALIDVYGYFKSDAPLRYRPIIACRAVDTRFADQGGPALGAPETRTFQIRGNCGVPLSAKAVAVNITTLGSAVPGHLLVYPSGTAAPGAGYITFDPSQGALGNGGIVALSTLPKDLAITSISSTHVIVDVFGYFE